VQATRAKDVSGVLACYTPDVLIYDLAPPLQSAGLETMQTDLEGGSPVGLVRLVLRCMRFASSSIARLLIAPVCRD
jgi:ketosteroid isomerase-like protein